MPFLLLREDKTNAFEKILSRPDKYSFLIILRPELQNHIKAIENGGDNLLELQSENELVKGKLEILFLEWLENEIQILETKKTALGEELFRLNIQRIDTESRIERIAIDKDELEYEE